MKFSKYPTALNFHFSGRMRTACAQQSQFLCGEQTPVYCLTNSGDWIRKYTKVLIHPNVWHNLIAQLFLFWLIKHIQNFLLKMWFCSFCLPTWCFAAVCVCQSWTSGTQQFCFFIISHFSIRFYCFIVAYRN